MFVTVNHWDDWLWFSGIIAVIADKYMKKTKDCRGLFKCACTVIHFSCVLLFAILWTVACQAPLSMGFSRQEHWSGLPLPSPAFLLELAYSQAHSPPPLLNGHQFNLHCKLNYLSQCKVFIFPWAPAKTLGTDWPKCTLVIILKKSLVPGPELMWYSPQLDLSWISLHGEVYPFWAI